MSWSLGEMAALALKATRGAGLPWGLAEEAAGAVFWLHQRNLPGISALCGYLASCDQPPRTDSALCPLVTGAALSDGSSPCPSQMDDSIDLGVVAAPLLLLPFVATISPGTIWLQAGMAGKAAYAWPDHWHSGWLRGSAACQLRFAAGPQIDPGHAHHTRLPDHFACCVDRLTDYAHRTYAPATSQSRLAGAGAGLTDND